MAIEQTTSVETNESAGKLIVRPNVFVTAKMSEPAGLRLASFADVQHGADKRKLTNEEVLSGLKGKNSIICLLGEVVDAKAIEQNPDLLVIANHAVGYDNIDVACATKYGVMVNNTPGVLDNATADLAFALLLACTRRIVESDRFVRDGLWTEWKTDLMLGHDLSGKTVGIVGLGRIGMAFAKRAQAFGLNIIYTRNGNDPEKDREISTSLGAKRLSFIELLKQSDYVSIHCPLNSETRHLFNQETMSHMKDGAILINTSRGSVVNERVLTDLLKSGKLGGAGLDVFEAEPRVTKELYDLPNVVLTPHSGSATKETRLAMAELAVDGLRRAFSGELPANCINKEVFDFFRNRLEKKR